MSRSLPTPTLPQLAIGVGWSAGMLGIGATSGPGLTGGLFGRLYLVRLLRRRPGALVAGAVLGSRSRVVVRLILLAVVGLVWWFGAGQWLADALTRPGGILVDPPHVPR